MNAEKNTGLGYMIVRVTTARGAIPLENAVVSIHNYAPEFESGRGDVIAVYTTGASGLTERFALPSPPRELSMSPGMGKSYATYNLSIAHPGFYKQYYTNVPVFEGITAIQSADLIPLPDNGETDNFTTEDNVFFEIENPLLENGASNQNNKGDSL